MQVSVEHTSTVEKRLCIQIPSDDITPKVDARLREIGKQVRLKGFRPGRVPFSVLRQRFGKQAQQEVIQEAVQSSLQQAIEQESLRIAASPRLDGEPKLDDENGLAFNAIIETFPEFEAIDVSNLEIEKPDVSVTEDDISEMLETLRKQKMSWSEVEGAPSEGDQVLIEYQADTGDGMKPEEDKYRLAIMLGESGFKALEKAVSKMAAGDEKKLKLQFPEDFREAELAGKKADVLLTVSKVQKGELPEIDEDFVKTFGIESGDVDELRGEIRNNMERELGQAVATQLKTQLADGLLKMHPDLEVPQSIVDGEARNMLQQMIRGAEIEITGEMLEHFREPARKRVCSGLLLGELARQNKVKIDGAKVREAIEEIAQTYEQSQEVVQMYYKDQRLLQAVENSVLENQVVDWAVNNAKVTDKAMKFQEAINKATQAAGA